MTQHLKLAAASLLVLAFASAQAADVGQHPAVFSPRSLPAVDANTFIVGHPAGPVARTVHANADHPALASHAAVRGIDANTFLVQPPVGARWRSEETLLVVTAAPR